MMIHLLVHHQAWGLILLVLNVLLLEFAFLRSKLLVQTWIIKIFVPLFDCKKYFTALVTQFAPLLAKTVIIVHVFLCPLCVLNLLVVNEGVRPVFGVGLCLLHPDSFDPTIS